MVELHCTIIKLFFKQAACGCNRLRAFGLKECNAFASHWSNVLSTLQTKLPKLKTIFNKLSLHNNSKFYLCLLNVYCFRLTEVMKRQLFKFSMKLYACLQFCIFHNSNPFLIFLAPPPPTKVCETIICNVCVQYQCVKLYKCSDMHQEVSLEFMLHRVLAGR